MKAKKIAGRLFKIPLLRRTISINGADEYEVVPELMEVDGFGAFVCFKPGEEILLEKLRIGDASVSETDCIVVAVNVFGAIAKVCALWDGMNVGGLGEKNKALWINRDKPIKELPSCEKMWINEKSQFTCGEPQEEGGGEYGMCALEDGYDCPEYGDCPLKRFRHEDHAETIEIAGVLFKVIYLKRSADTSD